MTDHEDPTVARRELIATADLLRRVLYNVNLYGDTIDSDLAHQRDGSCYGELYDGFKILVRTLYPDDGIEGRADQIIDTMVEGAIDYTTVEVAAQHVMDKHSPLSRCTTNDVREDLARYHAYRLCLADGMLDITKLIGDTATDLVPGTQAAMYLDERIAECRAALAYRGEPETLLPDYVRLLIAPEDTDA